MKIYNVIETWNCTIGDHSLYILQVCRSNETGKYHVFSWSSNLYECRTFGSDDGVEVAHPELLERSDGFPVLGGDEFDSVEQIRQAITKRFADKD